MRWLSDLRGTLRTSFGIGRATISAASLTAARTVTLPDKSGTVALVGSATYSVGDVKSICHGVIPAGWVVMDGAIYNVADYPEAAELLGDRYGGDGITTFGVPNSIGRSLRGSAVSDVGEIGGNDSATLTTDQLPSHSHDVKLKLRGENNTTGAVAQPSATENILGRGSAGPSQVNIWYSNEGSVPVDYGAIEQISVGTGSPVDIRNPYLNVVHIIAIAVVG
jgi:microcystin-dependent protein